MDSVLPEPPLLVGRGSKGGSVDGTMLTSNTTKGPAGAVVLTVERRTAEEGVGAPEGGTRGRAERRSVFGRLVSVARSDQKRLCTGGRVAG